MIADAALHTLALIAGMFLAVGGCLSLVTWWLGR